MPVAGREVETLPELAIPLWRAQSAIFDTAIWHRYQAALAARRQTRERMSRFARMAGGPPIPAELRAAEELFDSLVAEARADYQQRLQDGRLKIWGRVGSIRGKWQPIEPGELSYLKPIQGDRDRWEGGGLCYYQLHVLDRVGAERELALRLYGSIKLVRDLKRLECDPGVDWEPGDAKPMVYRDGVSRRRSYRADADAWAAGLPDHPEAVAAERLRVVAKLQEELDAHLRAGRLIDEPVGAGGG